MRSSTRRGSPHVPSDSQRRRFPRPSRSSRVSTSGRTGRVRAARSRASPWIRSNRWASTWSARSRSCNADMLILLPPSETKREGGTAGTRLALRELGFPQLAPARLTTLAALEELARDPAASAAALKLGPTQAHEAERNRRIRRSPVLPALDRYDGVLYDALDASSLTPGARAFAHEHLVIASALFGLTRALDPIPAYRLSADSRLPGISL